MRCKTACSYLQDKHVALCDSSWILELIYGDTIIFHGLLGGKINIQSLVAIWLFDDSTFSLYIFPSINRLACWSHSTCCLW